jgi:hypothetical protein
MPLVAASFLQVADPNDGIPPNPADFASSAKAGFGGMKTLPGAEGLVWGQAVMGWTPPRRPWCARVVAFVTTEQEASVSEVSTIGLDLAKYVFQAHGADAS